MGVGGVPFDDHRVWSRYQDRQAMDSCFCFSPSGAAFDEKICMHAYLERTKKTKT